MEPLTGAFRLAKGVFVTSCRKMCASALLLALIPSAASSQINPIKCSIADAGHTIQILGSNPTRNPITCTRAECTATTTTGVSWICQASTTITLPSGASNIPIATCSANDRTAKSVEESAHSCN